MNFSQPNANEALQTKNRSRSVAPQSGICARCVDGCKGNCDLFQATFRGRELLYPSPFGKVTAGADKDYPVDYSHLNINGYAIGAEGIEADPDHAVFPQVTTETWYGATEKIKMKVPMFTGALGSTEIARANWEHFAVGAAISGISLVCGENVCGIDPKLEIDKNGKVTEAPDMRRRVESYRRYQEGYGDIMVQMNVEDTRLGVAEYVIDKLGVDTIELKWGQGAKCIGGEIKVDSLERAQELQKRGYIVTPDPSNRHNQKAFKDGSIKEFERHSRVGFLDQDEFMKEVDRVRKLGAKRVKISLPHTQYAVAVYYVIAPSEASSNLARYDGVKYGFRNKDNTDLMNMYRSTRSRGFGPEVQRRIIIGTYCLSAGYYDAYYGKASQVRTLITEDFKRAYETCDVIACPVAPTAAPPTTQWPPPCPCDGHHGSSGTPGAAQLCLVAAAGGHSATVTKHG